jgi:hypothetical protein
VSVTEVSINTQKKKMDVSCKAFTNDLEEAIKKLYGKSFDLKNTKDEKGAEEILKKYFNAHVSIKVGDALQILEFIGYEVEEEAVWCHFEVNDFNAKGKIIITNSILFDYISAQNNLIHCTYNGTRKSTRLVNPDKKAEFNF